MQNGGRKEFCRPHCETLRRDPDRSRPTPRTEAGKRHNSCMSRCEPSPWMAGCRSQAPGTWRPGSAADVAEPHAGSFG